MDKELDKLLSQIDDGVRDPELNHILRTTFQLSLSQVLATREQTAVLLDIRDCLVGEFGPGG